MVTSPRVAGPWLGTGAEPMPGQRQESSTGAVQPGALVAGGRPALPGQGGVDPGMRPAEDPERRAVADLLPTGRGSLLDRQAPLHDLGDPAGRQHDDAVV